MSWIVRAAFALWGLAFAIGLMPRLQRPATPDELPGAMRSAGLDASGPMLQFALLLVVPFLVTLLARPLLPKISEKRWVFWSFCLALATAPVTLMHFGTLRHVVMHGLSAALILAARRLDPRFTRTDIVLLPTLLSLYFAFWDIGFGKTPAATLLRAAMVVFALRIAIGAISKRPRPALAFIVAPLALLFQLQWGAPALAAGLAIAWMLLTPFALTVVRIDDQRLRRFAAFVAYPIIAAAYPLALAGVISPPQLDVFEDSHSLLPASEMARGELPYRDIVPMHGLLSDGVIDLAVMQIATPNLGNILTTRRAIAALTVAAIYFVALAATTSADLALLAVFLSLAIYPPASLWMRAMPALLAVASVAAATRLRARRWFLVAGVLLVIAGLFSLDLAVFSAVVALIAAARSRALKPLFIGIAAAVIPLLLVFAVLGVLGDFFSTTFVEVLGSGDVYVIGPFDVPPVLRTLAHTVVHVSEYEGVAILVWVIALVAAAAALSRSPLRAHRSDAVWMIALWIVIAGASWVVRRHYYFGFAIAPFLVASLLAVRRQSRPAAIALAIALAFFAKPFSHVFDLALPLRRAGGILAAEATRLPGIPRAQGAVLDERTKKGVESVSRFLRTLKPGETFYDFSSVGMLYFLFDRPCPTRHPTVPAYESEEMQRTVIAELERDKSIRAALIAFPTGYIDIDGVHNRDRAPLIWKYLQEHFTQTFAENGVVFWTRK